MTHFQVSGLSGRCWSIQDVHLTEGYYVLLVPDQEVANELAQQLTGVSERIKGSVRLNGHSPQREPAARATCASVLTVETRFAAGTVRSALKRLAEARIVAQDTQAILDDFGLHSLAERDLESLSASERRQLAFATAIARPSAALFVYCEPRLDLTEPQRSKLQEYMSERATQSCVLCITASQHDARLLGGPHAQLTRNGWVWLCAAAGVQPPATRVIVEGTGLRSVGAELALNADVSELVLQNQGAMRESLQLVARIGSTIAIHVMRAARQNHANIHRLHVEEQASGSIPFVAPTSHSRMGEAATVSGNCQDCNLVRIALSYQAEILRRSLRTPTGAFLIFAPPLMTTAYAAEQVVVAPAEATQNALHFLVTYIVPFWSLLLVRAFSRDSSLAGIVEPLARFGANRRMLLGANWGLISLVGAAVATASAVLAVLKTAGPAWADVCVAAWIIALGTTAYVAVFSALRALVRGVWFQYSFLFADLVLGGTALGLSAFFPHAHLLNLIGAPGVIDLAQRTSSACLGLVIFLAFGLTWTRTKA